MKLLKKAEQDVEDKPGFFKTVGRHFGLIKKAGASEKKIVEPQEEEDNTITRIKKNRKMLEEASGIKRLAYPRKQ